MARRKEEKKAGRQQKGRPTGRPEEDQQRRWKGRAADHMNYSLLIYCKNPYMHVKRMKWKEGKREGR